MAVRQRMWANINEAGEIVDLMRVCPHLSGPTGTRTAEVVVYEGDPQSELEAERAAHAAEVARYREAIGHSLGFHAHLHGDECPCSGCTALRAALAAPPTAAAQAVRELIHATYEVIGGLRARRAVFPDAPPSKVAIARLDAALAAWEEATR